MQSREIFTLVVSALVLVTALIYWAVQVSDVLVMLEMAYG